MALATDDIPADLPLSPRQKEAESMVKFFEQSVYAELTVENMEAFYQFLVIFNKKFLHYKQRNQIKSLPIFDARIMLMLDEPIKLN